MVTWLTGRPLTLLSHPPVPFAKEAASSIPALVVWRRGRVGNAARNQGVTAFAIRLRSVAMEVGLCRCGISAVRTVSGDQKARPSGAKRAGRSLRPVQERGVWE